MFRYITQEKTKDNYPKLLKIIYVWHNKKVTFLFAFHSNPDQCEQPITKSALSDLVEHLPRLFLTLAR